MSVLSKRALNRALLARQMLLSRSDMAIPDALEHLAGLQAQAPNPPYFALWARLEGFRHEELSRLFEERQVVRIALMRSTIHLVTAQDCLRLRPLTQPAHDRGLKGAFGKRLEGLEPEALAAAGRALVEREPLTLGELGKRMQPLWPDRDPSALANAVRTYVPLVQVPPRGLWGASGQAVHTSAEAWLGRPLSDDFGLDGLALRYLAAFGPATVKDMQAWSGLTRLKETVDGLRPRLALFHDERGNELFDLPDAPRPVEDTPAPARLLSEFDGMLLAYEDYDRIISRERRKRLFTVNGLVPAALLVDGFVRGSWKLDLAKDRARLLVSSFGPLEPEDRASLALEGERLLEFAAPHAASRDIRFIVEES